MSEVCVNNVLCLCRLSNKQLIDQYFQKNNLYIRLEREELCGINWTKVNLPFLYGQRL